MRRIGYFLLTILLVGGAIKVQAQQDTVAVLVDSLIYDELEMEIAEYVTSVEAAFPVKLMVFHDRDWKNKEYFETRQYIKGLWETYNIKGVVMVGFFPLMLYQVYGQGTFPMVQAIGYEDIDGEFTDEGAFINSGGNMVFMEGMADDTIYTDAHGHTRIFTDSIYDHHYWADEVNFSDPDDVAEKVQLELWIALIRPYQDVYNEIEYTENTMAQMKDYFARCNRYNKKELPYQRRGFVQSSSDWGSDVPVLSNIIKPIYGEGNVAAYPPSSSGYSYMRERGIGMEVAFYYAHSASWFHQNDRGPFGSIATTDLVTENGPGALLTLGFNCHGADYLETPTGCLGQHYIFEGNGLSFVGNTISTGNSQIPIAQKMRDGKYLGQAFLETLNNEYQSEVVNNPYPREQELWGNVILGTPFIWMNEDIDMSSPGAQALGQTSNGEDVILTFFKNENMYTIAQSTDGAINVTKLDTGNYVVEVETVNGLLLPEKMLTISSIGEVISDWDIEIPETGPMFPESYYLKLASNNDLPSDWDEDGANLFAWDVSDAQVIGKYVQDYFFLNSKKVTLPNGNVFIRKHFNVYNPNPEMGVYVYSAYPYPSLYVNGVTISKEPAGGGRNLFSAFNTCFEISDALVEGANYMVGKSNDNMHMTDPVYEMMTEPIVTPPLTPTEFLVTTIEENLAQFTWIDNSDNEDGFILERKIGNSDYEIAAYLGMNKSELVHEIDPEDLETTYRIHAYNYSGKSDYSNESALAINNILFENMKIYPVPFDKILTIENLEGELNVSITNVIGQVIFTETFKNGSLLINTEEFEKGVYFISLTTSNDTRVTKSVIKY